MCVCVCACVRARCAIPQTVAFSPLSLSHALSFPYLVGAADVNDLCDRGAVRRGVLLHRILDVVNVEHLHRLTHLLHVPCHHAVRVWRDMGGGEGRGDTGVIWDV